MSTTTVHDQIHQDQDVEVEKAKPMRRTLLARLLTWYKAAVTKPESEQEKAEWQQNSF